MSHPTLDQLKRAIVISEKIEALEAELAAIFGQKVIATKTAAPTPAAAPSGKKKVKFSAEAREKIAAAQRARWAKIREKKGGAKAAAKAPAATAPAVAAPATKRKKPKMSAQGLANIRAAQKARWAKIKESKKA